MMDVARPAIGARTSPPTSLRAAGLLLFLLAAQFMTMIMLLASVVPDYDYRAAAISDLGALEESALLFNLSLVAVGVLNVVGGYLYFRSHGVRWIFVLFCLAGLGAIGAGLVPLDRGGLHSVFALVAFLAFNLEAMAVARVVSGPMRPLSVLAGALGLVFVVLMAMGDSGQTAALGAIGHGGTERMIVYPAMVWMLALGGYLMAAHDPT